MSEIRNEILNNNLLAITMVEALITRNGDLYEELITEFTNEEQVNGLLVLSTMLLNTLALERDITAAEMVNKVRQNALTADNQKE